MKSKLTRTLATVLTLAMLFSCMAFAAPVAFAAEDDSSTQGDGLDKDKLVGLLLDPGIKGKIARKVALWTVGNAIEGAGEGIGDYFENIGENAGDAYEDWAESGSMDGDIGDITKGLIEDATSEEGLGEAAADGAMGSFPLCLVGKLKPETGENINETLKGAFTGAFGKVFDMFPEK